MVPRLMDIEGLMQYISLGKNNAREFGAAAGAVVRYRTRVLYDREKIDQYIDGMGKEQK